MIRLIDLEPKVPKAKIAVSSAKVAVPQKSEEETSEVKIHKEV
jgi:hypothetical protein